MRVEKSRKKINYMLGSVYKITNLITNKVYIGITKRCIFERFKEHIEESKRSKTYFHNSIRYYKKDNFIITELEKTSLETISDREIFYIALYNSNNKKYGYNSTIGGEGVKGHPSWCKGLTKETHESVKRLSEKQMGKNNSFYGKTHTPEQKAKWKRERVGVNHPQYGMKWPKTSERNKNKVWTNLERAKIAVKRSKLIQCVETQDYFLGIRQASKFFKINEKCILQVLKKRQKTTKGLTFIYINNDDLLKQMQKEYLNQISQ